MNQLIENTPGGLFCRAGKFYIDPRRPVPKAVITHAHADHARGGSSSYLCSRDRLFPQGVQTTVETTAGIFSRLLRNRQCSFNGLVDAVSQHKTQALADFPGLSSCATSRWWSDLRHIYD